jgi:hypothetical protein
VSHVDNLFHVGFFEYAADDGGLVEVDEVVDVIVLVLAWSLGDAVAAVVADPYVIALCGQQVREGV